MFEVHKDQGDASGGEHSYGAGNSAMRINQQSLADVTKCPQCTVESSPLFLCVNFVNSGAYEGMKTLTAKLTKQTAEAIRAARQ